MKISKVANGLFSLVVASRLPAESGANDQFLKEILMGRCYEQNPSRVSCNELVGSFVNVLESHLESDPSLGELFDRAYVGRADFAPPEGRAMIWVGSRDPDGAGVLSAFRDGGHYWATPETTPGGRMLGGLTFCARAVGPYRGCSREDSNAYRAFWRAAYAEFAASVEGRLEIVLDGPRVDTDFLYDSVFEDLDAARVASVELWGVDCASSVATNAVSFLEEKRAISAICQGPRLMDLILRTNNEESGKDGSEKKISDVDHSDMDNSGSPAAVSPAIAAPVADSAVDAKENHEVKETSHNSMKTLFIWILLAACGYLYYKGNHQGAASVPAYERIKGDVVLPGLPSGGGTTSLGGDSTEYATCVDSVGGNGSSNRGGSIPTASQ